MGMLRVLRGESDENGTGVYCYEREKCDATGFRGIKFIRFSKNIEIETTQVTPQMSKPQLTIWRKGDELNLKKPGPKH